MCDFILGKGGVDGVPSWNLGGLLLLHALLSLGLAVLDNVLAIYHVQHDDEWPHPLEGISEYRPHELGGTFVEYFHAAPPLNRPR